MPWASSRRLPMIRRWWRGAAAWRRTGGFSMGKCDSKPSAAMRGPPMPANSIPGLRAFSAAIRWAASRSPEASPATMPTRRCRAIVLADDAAFTTVEKFEDVAHRAALRDLGFERLACLFQAETAAVKRAVGALQPGDRLGRKAAPLQAFAVDAVGLRHVARGLHEGRQILRQIGAHAGEGVRADVHELVHERRGAEDRPVADGDMAGELAGVGEHRVAADLAVVREVHVGHDPVVIAHARTAAIQRGAAVDGDALAEGVAVADLDRGVLAAVLLVLRRRAERGEMEDLVVAPDAQSPVEHDVRADPAALADFDLGADHAVGPNAHASGKACGGIHQGGGVDLRAHWASIDCIEQRMVASATTLPSTRALQLNFAIPRSCRSKCTSISSWSPGTTGRLKRALSMPT